MPFFVLPGGVSQGFTPGAAGVSSVEGATGAGVCALDAAQHKSRARHANRLRTSAPFVLRRARRKSSRVVKLIIFLRHGFRRFVNLEERRAPGGNPKRCAPPAPARV